MGADKGDRGQEMKELVRTNDPVRLSWLQALLSSEGIEVIILDGHTSVLEGSINAIQRRVMVADGVFEKARAILRAAGESLDGR